MNAFDPALKGHISHSGTFNGNAATMRAGLASLHLLDQPAIDRINALGGKLARGFDEAFQEAGIAGQTTFVGSLVQVHWQRGEIANMDDVARGFRAAGEVPLLLHLELMNRGIFAAARGEYNTSTAMADEHVGRTVSTFNDVLHYLKPHLAERHPALLI
jgi:glutamate-1-semialdehyde 2,1-aminomutase